MLKADRSGPIGWVPRERSTAAGQR